MFVAVWYLREIFLVIVAALVFGSAIQIWALWLKNKTRLPFIIGVFIIYLTLITVFGLTIYGLFPVLKEELKTLVPKIQPLLSELQIKENFVTNQILSSISDTFSNLGPLIFNILGGIFSTMLILILSFYFTTQLDLYKSLITALPIKQKEKTLRVWVNARRKFAFWLGGQFILMLIIGLATYTLMKIFGIPNALLIGTIAGLTEIIPVLGPIISASIALLVVLIEAPQAIWWILLGFIIIQQLENNLLVPVIMKKALSINPVFTLIAVLIGGAVGGVLGILTILPLMVLGVEIYKSLIE